MSEAFAQFEKRLNGLERKHNELAGGYVATINPDGLITIQPKEKRSGLVLRLLATMVLGFTLFKSVMLALVGLQTYNDRIDVQANGTVFEKLCAWIMQTDPVTLKIAEILSWLIG